ncbi:nuclear transport factor 2 family protein [Streptomyces ovatisporus]|uniref:Nuclear transport factor 2 family protein n=1 Tax=Streptomyces ovatisporus TaxID=1128682 RepID=A0ABV9A0X4_9ACTN
MQSSTTESSEGAVANVGLTAAGGGRPEGGWSTDSTRAVVEQFLQRLGEGDPERVAALFAERVDWMIAENPAVPWMRPRSTREDVAGHFAELAAGTLPEEAGNTVEAVIVAGGEAVVTGRLSGAVRATGKRFESPFALRLVVEDGLITTYRVYEDSLAVAAAFAV